MEATRDRRPPIWVAVLALAAGFGAAGGCAGRHDLGREVGGASRAERANNGVAWEGLAPMVFGEWRGTGPCDGTLTLRSDGSYERQHYSPGDYRVAGTWALKSDSKLTILSLTCRQSDHSEDVGQVETLALVRVDAEELVYQHGEGSPTRYDRQVTAAQRR